jgi:hypothetical protein
MIPVKNKLRVAHFPQVGVCKGCFKVEVKDEEQACFILNLMALQHLWLFENKVILDYSNIILVEMFDENIDVKTGKPYGWVNYYNEEEEMEWEEIEETYFSQISKDIRNGNA